jgi:ribonucleoside-diphosphate reductase alpha chain
MRSERFAEPESTALDGVGAQWDEGMLSQYSVIRRNGQLTHFDSHKIAMAMTKAFLAVEGDSAAVSHRIHQTVRVLTKEVIKGIARRLQENGTVHIEDIQDQVELALMRAGEHKVARAYVLYREEHAHQRSEKQEKNIIYLTDHTGDRYPLDEQRLQQLVVEASAQLEGVNAQLIFTETLKNLFNGISEAEFNRTLVLSARTFLEQEPNYTYVAARLLLDQLRFEALNFLEFEPARVTAAEMAQCYPVYFRAYLTAGICHKLLDTRLSEFDWVQLGAAIVAERDLQFTYLGLQTLYDRYFLHWNSQRFELPQAFFMRVAMGLALNESQREARAIEFYQLLSRFDLMCSTPTLFNAGTLRPQLSSCFISTIPDDLEGIFNAIKDNALLQKWAGGIGNDWSYIRGMGSLIKGTNGKSQGVVPFLKVANDTLVSVNQCFAPDTLVYTGQGIKPIKAVGRHELVLGQRGIYREVLENWCYLQQQAMVEIEFEYAIRPIQVTAGHPLWAVKNGFFATSTTSKERWGKSTTAELPAQWLEASQLEAGDYVAQVIPQEIVPVEDFSEIEARLYGIMLGKGYCVKKQYAGDTWLEWGVSGASNCEKHLDLICQYLTAHGIDWEPNQTDEEIQINWIAQLAVAREASTGQLVSEIASLPFDEVDLYNQQGEKHIAPRLSHLPLPQTLALVQGLIESYGSINREQPIDFITTSQDLAEGLRYQCLRLAIPVVGQFIERIKSYELQMPAVAKLIKYFDCQTVTQLNGFHYQNWLFTKVLVVKKMPPIPLVYDLTVEGDESYMTVAALAHNGGKRRGSGCAYLETWHIDIEEFLELRKNTGDERRRTHDMNTANWIPDLFMERVYENGLWTLFSPDEVAELHDLYGQAFKIAYEKYEQAALEGQLKIWKQVNAVELWRKLLTMLYETGHPWICFKEPCNLRSPQQHVGVVHSSNLCSEIVLNTSNEEIAVCNLSSINLANHITDKKLDVEKLQRTIRTGMRMLDNVIDINYYPVPQAQTANLRHRPVGLGVMGFQDALYQIQIPYASEEAIEFSDISQELISYYAISASCELAQERGAYSSFEGSLWHQGILPIDSLEKLAQQRGKFLEMSKTTRLDWDELREQVKTKGMRNSNCMAIAPTATISNICGVTQSIEPTYQNLYVKSNLSGEFTVINPYLVRDLKALGLWDQVMVNDLKFSDGRLNAIERIPDSLKRLYATAFEIEPVWLIEAASRRQKWLDQSQSLNLYLQQATGRKLDNIYKLAWLRGLKTTYYLRTLGATHVQKQSVTMNNETQTLPPVCALDDQECEACQ